jgi:hypothetical protein
MSGARAVVRCCERVVVAADEGDAEALRRRLRELSEEAADGPSEPALDEVRADATTLADGMADPEDGELPATVGREAKEIAGHGCQWYLEQVDVASESLPAVEAAADETAKAAERIARQNAELEAETVILAAQAKAVAAERTAAVEALERIMEQVQELETESGWLEETADLESVVEQEREHRRRKAELDEKLAELQEKLEDS